MKLDLSNISKSYGNNKALTNFTASLEPGIYALLGPNGSGKSTLMNIITDNLKADSGIITYSENGGEPENILDMDVRFREKLGFMPQYPGMYSGFSIEKFLWYIAALKNVGSHLKGKERKKFIAERINEILVAVELDDVARRKIGALSGGMKQRLALAQAVLGDPSILILDEPTAGLDPKQRIAIRNYISKIAFNKIVIIATHVVSDVEFVAKDIIILKKGVIVDYAPPAQLTEKIYGKVWNVYTDKESADDYQNRFRVTNISRDDEKVVLRIISESKPDENAVAAQPSLEDYYLYVFGDEAASGNQ
ncbi:MAG: ATP-binding cassette domain-containing protein [Ruminococcaceae bacterium]|nr:ATP-binding cassette domain-containing protein [Oscillospiraceae bacterium]